MTDAPVLSLCIPTYNRARLLAQMLDALAAQISPARAAQMEIVVSDNASTDDTPQVLADFQDAHSGVRLRRHRQPENCGPDANIYKTVQLAQGEFAYILSDDDMPLPGVVDALFDLLSRYPDFDAFALNIKSFADDPDEENPVWFPVAQDTVLHDRSEALTLLKPMFVSVFAFRRAPALAHDHSDKIGTFLLQSYLFLDVLARDRGIVITARPYLAQRTNNTAGWPFWRVMTTNFRDLLRYAERLGFSKPVLDVLLAKHLKDEIYASTRYYKLTGKHGPMSPTPSAYWDGIRRMFQVYGCHPFLLFVLIPLLLTPSGLLQGLRRFYKKFRPSPAP